MRNTKSVNNFRFLSIKYRSKSGITNRGKYYKSLSYTPYFHKNINYQPLTDTYSEKHAVIPIKNKTTTITAKSLFNLTKNLYLAFPLVNMTTLNLCWSNLNINIYIVTFTLFRKRLQSFLESVVLDAQQFHINYFYYCFIWLIQV